MNWRVFLVQKVFRYIPDGLWVRFKYFCFFHRLPNLADPKTFNEKIQWLKLYDRSASHTQMVDKYGMKQYVADRVGSEYVVPLLGVWDRVEDIDFESLPEQFVLKTTHDCGGLVICADKAKLDKEAAKQKLRKALTNDYYIRYREWPYKHVVPRIIAEKYLTDSTEPDLKDYKIWCFDGKPYCVAVDYDRFVEHKQRIYTPQWEKMEVSRYADDPDVVLEKPDTLEKMLEIAAELSKGEPFIRVDFYEVGGRPYVGELTFFPASGVGKFQPERYDRIFGDLLKLPPKNVKKGCAKTK